MTGVQTCALPIFFVWLITRLLPAQEKRREAERREEREAFLSSLKERDGQYLGTLADIRRSVEAHSDRHQQSKEMLSVAVQELTSEMRKSR